MDSVLIDRWLSGAQGISVVDEACASLVREEVRAVANDAGFDKARAGELVIAASELATNQLRHARYGQVLVRRIERDDTPGVELVAADLGVGIDDPEEALAGVPRISGSLGTGLSSVLRLCDEVDFDIRIREGTCVRARKFKTPVRRRREVGILGRPFPDERRSGDDAWFERHDDGLRVVLADGLGHGPEARHAASALIEHARRSTTSNAAVLLANAHDALVETRGAVASVVDLDERAGAIQHAALGNVASQIVSIAGGRAFAGPGLVVGHARAPSRSQPLLETHPLAARDLVLMFTDGLSTRTKLDARDEVTLRHPIVVASHLLREFGRDTDDATVVVVG